MANPILIDIMLWDNDPEGTLRCELNSKDLILYRISRAGPKCQAKLKKNKSKYAKLFGFTWRWFKVISSR